MAVGMAISTLVGMADMAVGTAMVDTEPDMARPDQDTVGRYEQAVARL